MRMFLAVAVFSQFYSVRAACDYQKLVRLDSFATSKHDADTACTVVFCIQANPPSLRTRPLFPRVRVHHRKQAIFAAVTKRTKNAPLTRSVVDSPECAIEIESNSVVKCFVQLLLPPHSLTPVYCCSQYGAAGRVRGDASFREHF